jgi:hypothetical protein
VKDGTMLSAIVMQALKELDSNEPRKIFNPVIASFLYIAKKGRSFIRFLKGLDFCF